mgnify:CR=1 FL=1
MEGGKQRTVIGIVIPQSAAFGESGPGCGKARTPDGSPLPYGRAQAVGAGNGMGTSRTANRDPAARPVNGRNAIPGKETGQRKEDRQ